MVGCVADEQNRGRNITRPQKKGLNKKKGLNSMKYKVEFAEFHKIEVEADSKKEAEEKAAVMDDEDILNHSVENTDMVVWDVMEM